MSKLEVRGLGFSVDQVTLIRDINLKVEKGELVGLIGPNGCGKSTLLKNIYRACKPDCGKVFLDDEDAVNISNKNMARRMSVMVQENVVEFDISVNEMVMLGRYAHKKLLADTTDADDAIVAAALEEVGMSDYRSRSFLSLSGGEKQRILIARALAQQAPLILLDEPTNHLDINYQYQIMGVLKKQQDLTVFSSIHDLNLAAIYCDRIILMSGGRIVCCGTPEEVITPENILEFFHVKAQVSVNSTTGKIQVYYIPDRNCY